MASTPTSCSARRADGWPPAQRRRGGPMLANETVPGDADRWWLAIGRPTGLIKTDRTRRIDRIIDYFGGGSTRLASVSRAPGAVRGDLPRGSRARAGR